MGSFLKNGLFICMLMGTRQIFGHLGYIVEICQFTYLQWILCAGNEKEPLATHVLHQREQLKQFFGGNLILNIKRF